MRIYGRDDILPRHRRCHHIDTLRDGVAVTPEFYLFLAVLAGQDGVVGEFQSAVRLVVRVGRTDPHDPDNLWSSPGAGRVVALALAEEADPGKLQCGDLVGRCLVHLPGNVGETSVACEQRPDWNASKRQPVKRRGSRRWSCHQPRA